ncbi:MAG: MinD/ParA family protein, partial [Candidatus Zixiibacteriota bacterium]
DTGSGLSNELISLSKIVDWTILTLTPELTAISDCYALYKWLLQSEPNVSASLVINRAGGPDEAADIAERFALLTSKFLDRKPYVVGYLSESDMIREAVARQRSLFADEPRVKSAAEFTRLAGRLSALSISQSGAQRLSSLREEVNLKA